SKASVLKNKGEHCRTVGLLNLIKMTKEIQNKLDVADKAFHEWKTVSFGDRKKLFKKLARLLEKNSSKLAEIITKEMGKPISQSVAEIEKCALMTRYYANAEN